MFKQIAAIVFILICTSTAWMILGSSIWSRTNDSTEKLTPDVASIWGTPQTQNQPALTYQDQASPSAPKSIVSLQADSSRVHVDLALEYRQKGLLWYSIYVVNFDGLYTFRNTTDTSRIVLFALPLPSKQAVYDDLSIRVNGQPQTFRADKDAATVSVDLPSGESASFEVAYRSQGLESWRYKFGDDVTQTRNFSCHLTTNFSRIDFPMNTLAPTEKHATPSGWDLTWRYKNLISGFQIGMTMPEKLQPGPLAGNISFFAPVSLLLYFFVMFILATIRKINLHPMNYFFLAASFFAFHLLLAYSVDHISIQLAFAISSLVSVGLAVSYLRIVVGQRFALLEAGLAQLVYLVLFSYTFFLNGFTGLAITIGCIITLFVAMQLTARMRWSDVFGQFSLRPQTSNI